jgi:hypothetical protein
MTSDNLKVEQPPGAGGAFLQSVLACCTTDLPWHDQTINYHKSLYKISGQHYIEPANNVISIDDSGARYNFWGNYYKKRVMYELEKSRYLGRRWIRSDQNLESLEQDGFWLLNQCRFIISYNSRQHWKISWIDMLTDPETCWKTILEYLQANHQHNYWGLDQWISAVNGYRQTLAKPTINLHHVRWQIWAIALLQEQRIAPRFSLIENFRKPIFLSWLDKHNDRLLELTKKYTYTPG